MRKTKRKKGGWKSNFEQYRRMGKNDQIGTAIHVAADGTITLANKSEDGYGNEVRIFHSNGFSTRYAHMYTFIVKKGMKIKKGDIIGFVGSTGKSTGSHIHYEVRKHGKAVDPEYFLSIPL